MKNYRKYLAVFGLILFSTFSKAQLSLRIGDPAPAFKYSKWIQGKPITQLDEKELYVLEFWATWCGPCVAAMPHLSELSDKFKDKATFVGVNIWEKTGDKPYESSLPRVTSFVKSMGSKLTYNVITDNNEQHMGDKWMKAAGQFGIPSTFLVKGGKIIWIGHPMKLDSIIPEVLAGRYDMLSFKRTFEAKTSQDKTSETMSLYYTPALAAIKERDYDKALDLVEKGTEFAPKFAMIFDRIRLMALLGKDEPKGIEYAREWIKKSPGVGSTLAGDILDRKDLTQKSFAFAAEIFRQSFDSNDSGMPLISHMTATAYAKAGDFATAVMAEQRAIEQAKIALKDGKFKDMVLETTVGEYEATLKEYQLKAANKK
ncbi:redoxin family protein [Pedobacter frigoris]|uniref:redoxin family protein n=1 Tax=Pedobacter frigoris TaxID=2571272 RepID=UPI002930FBC4|nr:redoxin domain-containing protein [Pedobacter frigoris]